MDESVRLSRRRFLKVGCRTLLGGLLAGVASALYAGLAEPNWLRIMRTTVTIPALPKALAGLKIGQLSDLHVESELDMALVKEAVRLLNAESPDLVVFTGDFVTGDATYSIPAAEALANVRASHGVYAVLGNHDVWTDADRIADALTGADISVLRDERRRLLVNGVPLWLLGIEDRGHTGFSSPGDLGDFGAFQHYWQDAESVLADLLAEIPSSDSRLLLVHNPDFVEMLPSGPIDLALSGHTHGGQVRVPFLEIGRASCRERVCVGV